MDVRPEALKVALQSGANEAMLADANTAKYIRSLVRPQPGGADVVLDFVGADSTLSLGASVVSSGGYFALVGLAGGQLRVAPGVGETGIPFETRVVIPFWGTKAELCAALYWCSTPPRLDHPRRDSTGVPQRDPAGLRRED